MTESGHFDQFPPTSPSVGCRLGQGAFAEAIRQLPRRAENGPRGRSTPRRRPRLLRRQADDPLLRLQFAIIIAPGNLRPCRGEIYVPVFRLLLPDRTRMVCDLAQDLKSLKGEMDNESWCGLSAGRTWRRYRVKAFARAAEDLGYDHVVIYDHVLGAVRLSACAPILTNDRTRYFLRPSLGLSLLPRPDSFR